MVPIGNTTVQTLTPHQRWEEKSARYRKDLIIKRIALAAIPIIAVGVIACGCMFTAVPIAVKVLLSLGLASFALSGFMKVHLDLHPFRNKKYNSPDDAAKVCDRIRNLKLPSDKQIAEVADIDRTDPKMVEEYLDGKGKFITRSIKEWVRYGFIEQENGKALLTVFKRHLKSCKLVEKLKNEESEANKALYDNAITQKQTSMSSFEDIMANLVITDLPF